MANRGDAAFVYTAPTGQSVVHRLGSPLRIQSARHTQRRFVARSLDYSTTNVVTIGSGRHDLVAHVRYDALPQGLVDLLRHGANGVQLTYWPSLSGTVSYDAELVVDGDVVEAPIDPDRHVFGEHMATVLLRRAGSWEGALYRSPILFRFRAGESLERATFSRASVANAIAKDGTLVEVAAGVPRTEWLDLDGDGVRETPVLLLEDGGTNVVAYSEDFGQWTSAASGTRTAGQDDPMGGTGAYLLDDTDAVNAYTLSTEAAFASDGDKAVSLFVREGDSPPSSGAEIALSDTDAAVTRAAVGLTWDSGAPVLVGTRGSPLIFDPVPCRDGWYRIAFQAPDVVSSNTNVLVIQPSGIDNTDMGDLYVFGAQAEDSPFPSSYIATVGTEASRNGEAPVFTAPGLRPPFSIYVRFVDMGTSLSEGFKRIVALGDVGERRIDLQWGPNDETYDLQISGGSLATAVGEVPSGTDPPEFGDVVELLGTVDADGAPQLTQSVNGGTAAVGTAGAAVGWEDISTKLTVNAIVAGNSVASNGYRDIVIASGVRTLDDMRRLVA